MNTTSSTKKHRGVRTKYNRALKLSARDAPKADVLVPPDQFFAPGRRRQCTYEPCVGAIANVICAPAPPFCPTNNACCSLLFNLNTGASYPNFIWPTGCPVATPCTLCLPPQSCAYFCCCASPETRCKSCIYIGQRVFNSAAANAQQLYPVPWPRRVPGGETPPALTHMSRGDPAEEESYRNGTNVPSARSAPNRFAKAFASIADLGSAMTFVSVGIRSVCYLKYDNYTMTASTTSGGNESYGTSVGAEYGGVWLWPISAGEALPTPYGSGGPNAAPDAKAVGNRVIIYIHGGAFACCTADEYQWIVGEYLTHATGQVVLIPSYETTSTDPFPEALEQMTKVYVNCVELYGADNVVLMGDSAGGNLCLTTIMNAANKYQTASPAGCVLFSPWVDLRDSALFDGSIDANNPANGGLPNLGKADFLPPNAINLLQYAYANKADRSVNPLISPQLATSDMLAALPPVFFTHGDQEVLYDQQFTMVNTLKNTAFAGAGKSRYSWYKPTKILDDSNYYLAADMPHVYNVLGYSMVYESSCCLNNNDTSAFEPVIGWAKAFDFLRQIPGWENTLEPAR